MEGWLACLRSVRTKDMLKQHTGTWNKTVPQVGVPPSKVLTAPDTRPGGGQCLDPSFATAQESSMLRMLAANVALI